MPLKRCQIDYSINGTKAHTVIYAPSSIDALLRLLETLPPTVAVKALVRVLLPTQ